MNQCAGDETFRTLGSPGNENGAVETVILRRDVAFPSAQEDFIVQFLRDLANTDRELVARFVAAEKLRVLEVAIQFVVMSLHIRVGSILAGCNFGSPRPFPKTGQILRLKGVLPGLIVKMGPCDFLQRFLAITLEVESNGDTDLGSAFTKARQDATAERCIRFAAGDFKNRVSAIEPCSVSSLKKGVSAKRKLDG